MHEWTNNIIDARHYSQNLMKDISKSVLSIIRNSKSFLIQKREELIRKNKRTRKLLMK